MLDHKQLLKHFVQKGDPVPKIEISRVSSEKLHWVYARSYRHFLNISEQIHLDVNFTVFQVHRYQSFLVFCPVLQRASYLQCISVQ